MRLKDEIGGGRKQRFEVTREFGKWCPGAGSTLRFSVACSNDQALITLDIVVFNDLEPALLLALLVGGERLGRAGQDLHVELLDELLADVGRAHCLGDL